MLIALLHALSPCPLKIQERGYSFIDQADDVTLLMFVVGNLKLAMLWQFAI